MASPGTNSRAGGLIHFPSRFTRAFTASFAFSASMGVARLAFFPEPDDRR